jgi:predicted nucleic acid-binding protein
MRLTLDSSILIYAAHADHPRHAPAASVLNRAMSADCVQTLQSLGECFRVLTVRRRWPVVQAIEVLGHLRAGFPLVAAEPVDLETATAAVRDHALSFWDAMLWATARRAGCRLLLSEDGQDGRELGGVRWLNPFRDMHRSLLDLVLAPSR